MSTSGFIAMDRRGSGNGNSRLTEEQVLSIRDIYGAALPDNRRRRRGMVTMQALGEQFGVSTRTIKAIIARKLWRHI